MSFFAGFLGGICGSIACFVCMLFLGTYIGHSCDLSNEKTEDLEKTYAE
jgi:hypothetical protein